LGDDRKTVLKFAVNAKQISTPLLGWANILFAEGGWKIGGWRGKWQGKGKALLGERQLCFQLICSELHLALHWQIGRFASPRSHVFRGGRMKDEGPSAASLLIKEWLKSRPSTRGK